IFDMPEGPAKEQSAKDRIMLSAGILITAAAPDGKSGHFLRDIRFENIEGTGNGDSIGIDPFNGGGHPAEVFQDVTMNHLYLHEDDGLNPGGIPDALRFFSVKNITVMNSRLDKECGQWSSRGTAAVFLCNLESIMFVNSMFTNTQDTKSYDQGAIDYEGTVKTSWVRNCYFGHNAGPGVEFLDIHGEGSYSDNHEISGNSFEGNGWAALGGQTGTGGIHHLGMDTANGIIRDNLFYEPGKPMFHGEFKNFKLVNNITAARSLYNSMNDFSELKGNNGWSYQYQPEDGAWKEMVSFDAARQVWVAGKGRSQAWIGRFEQCTSKSLPRMARVWKAPFTGRITIRGRALKSYIGGAEALVQITLNEKPILVPQALPVSSRDGIDMNVRAINVTQGDLIRFESIGAAKDVKDAVSWAPTIAYVDEAKR
ncbi:MAG: hypothetical protein ACYC0V_18415, partial [Armatimonadota bacterium]